jgi:catechol 2,3-dioxygenase-like lactoylglutathione lyase family enzyme
MAIVRLQHIGVAVKDLKRTEERVASVLGMRPRDFRSDQGRGFQRDSRVLLGNDCWLHLVHNWNPESRVGAYLQREGEGLEHIALESDDIDRDVARLRALGVPIFENRIIDANDGFEAFVFPEDGIGFTVELIAPHSRSWGYPEGARNEAVSETLPVTQLRDVVALASDVGRARQRFESLFALSSAEGRILLGNNAGLVLKAGGGPGLDRIVLESRSVEREIPESESGLPFHVSLVR